MTVDDRVLKQLDKDIRSLSSLNRFHLAGDY